MMEIEQLLEDHLHHFLKDLKIEGERDKEAGQIITDYIKRGKITVDQEQTLKIQVFDSLKLIGVGIPFILIPGAAVLVPIIIKVASRHNIDLLPSAFNDQPGNPS